MILLVIFPPFSFVRYKCRAAYGVYGYTARPLYLDLVCDPILKRILKIDMLQKTTTLLLLTHFTVFEDERFVGLAGNIKIMRHCQDCRILRSRKVV